MIKGLRQACLKRLGAEVIRAQALCSVLKLAIDGVDAAGKSTLARELTQLLRAEGLDVVSVSIDDFHRPRAQRYLRGRDSAEGFYRDSFNYAQFVECVLEPLQGAPPYSLQTKAFDHHRDQAVTAQQILSGPGVLLAEGIFLQCPELRQHWDLCVFVDVSFETALTRNLERAKGPDFTRWSSVRQADFVAEQQARYLRRYRAGQELYFAEVGPREQAQFVWQNDHVEAPELLCNALPSELKDC